VGRARKIGAHYIFLPGHPLVKGGHVVWEEGEEPVVVATGGVTREIEGLEFHGGMIVAGFIREAITDWRPGDPLLERLAAAHASRRGTSGGLALLQGAAWDTLRWSDTSTIERIK
jgi:hypothetical protein